MSDVESMTMRPDAARVDYGPPPTWTEADGRRGWFSKILSPAVDTPLAPAAFLLVGIFYVYVVHLVGFNLREGRFDLTVAVGVLLGGVAIARYAWRVWIIWRLTR